MRDEADGAAGLGGGLRMIFRWWAGVSDLCCICDACRMLLPSHGSSEFIFNVNVERDGLRCVLECAK